MIGWLDCAAGASGDMFLGALVDAGAPVAAMQEAIDTLPVERVELRVGTVERHGIGATRVDVLAAPSTTSRNWAAIRGMLESADLPAAVAGVALRTFELLAHAEAAVHRTTPEQVHFHEVGALDAIADIVGTAAGVAALGLDRLAAGTVTLGTGLTRGEHGGIPIPAPATLAVLSAAGAPVCAGPAPYEMCTPTGAALLAATVSDWGPMPTMTVRTVGSGAGRRSLDELPNLLRLVLGEPAGGGAGGVVDGTVTDEIVVEANVDDLDPRVWPGVLDRLLAAGAADAWLTPIVMKKGRPAHTVHVLSAPGAVAAVHDVLFTHTSTIGLRQRAVTKVALDRESGSVTVRGHRIAVKVARRAGRVVNVSVEFDDVSRAAAALDLPARAVLAEATAAARN